jgi:hypothetical protein
MQKPAVEIRGSRVMRAAMASSAISARGRVMQHPGVDRGYSDDGMTCAGPSCAGIYEKDMDKEWPGGISPEDIDEPEETPSFYNERTGIPYSPEHSDDSGDSDLDEQEGSGQEEGQETQGGPAAAQSGSSLFVDPQLGKRKRVVVTPRKRMASDHVTEEEGPSSSGPVADMDEAGSSGFQATEEQPSSSGNGVGSSSSSGSWPASTSGSSSTSGSQGPSSSGHWPF